jgi:hypothetical protein
MSAHLHALGGWTIHPNVYSPSVGGGDLSNVVRERLREIADHSPSLGFVLKPSISRPMRAGKELRLFNASAALKIAASEVSMHLPKEWRKQLFEKIDDLHEPDDWEDSDRLADVASFKTFLRTVLQQGPMKRMSLGISDDGQILAGWKRDKDSLSLAFLADDRIRWSVVRHIDGEIESAAGTTTLGRLREVLRPYNPEVWFGYADDVPSP